MTEKLEPCPFCGADNLTILDNGESHPGTYWVACMATDCQAEGPLDSSREGTILAWNRRAKGK